jgi:hypothetical protein
LVACANLHIRSAAAEIADANKRIEEATDLIDPMIEAQGSQLHFVDKLWEPEEVQPPSEWNADGVWHAHCVEAGPARSGKDRGVHPAAIASSHRKKRCDAPETPIDPPCLHPDSRKRASDAPLAVVQAYRKLAPGFLDELQRATLTRRRGEWSGRRGGLKQGRHKPAYLRNGA